ncbi:CHASE domain-containing protein [Massilia sp. TS11]|uniref:CHASE domain-containing protein n=1 Tax=Massilia sp. TS11 TaxID=2908003 RepID=UPI001EDBD312|nr:CHASE domain-containing protein [Massilia sp. TS11]MCG2585039.1 CHASE domain-containing protein [Massilia sp. TS11]
MEASNTPSGPLSRTRWFSPVVLSGLVFALCLGLTLVQWRGAMRNAEQDVQADFDYRVRELMTHLDSRMNSYVQMLRGLQGLFAGSGEVTRQDFEAYATALALDVNYPGVYGVGFMAYVPAAQRARHEALMRRSGFPDYSVHPAGERAFYAPVHFLEPYTGLNIHVLGFDPTYDPVRRAVLEQARDSGAPAMSGKLNLVQEQGREHPQSGFLVLLPIYRNSELHVSLDQRRHAIEGWVYAPFRVGALVEGLGGERANELYVEFYDGDAVLPANRLLTGSEIQRPVLSRVTEQRISIAGRRWTVLIGALPAFEARLATERPRLILGVGLLFTAVLTLITLLLSRSRARTAGLLEQSRSLTRELDAGQKRLAGMADAATRTQAMLRSILDSTIDGILVDNGDRHILASNSRFRELWSVPPELDIEHDDAALLEHMVAQLTHPAPFLYSRSLSFDDSETHRDLLRLKDGRFFEQFTRSVRLGQDTARLWSFRDITERKQIEQRERSHRHVLELLARGAPLRGILEAVVLGVEATNPGMLCSITLVSEDGRRMVNAVAPSLPAFYMEAVNHLEIGHGVGSCGTAIATGARVIAEDLQQHPYWKDYRDLVARARLGACWSEPIRGAAGKILGAFAIYHRQPTYPSPANVVLLEQSAQLAGIAIEQAQAAQAVRAGEERFRSLYDNAPVALWEQDWSAVREAIGLLMHQDVDDIGAYLRERPAEVRRLAGLVRIVDVNAAALNQVGAGTKEVALLGMSQVFDDSAAGAFAAAVAALTEGSQTFHCESSFVRLDGVQRSNEVTLLVMPGHAHLLDFVIVSTLDITERKRMDAELLALATTDFLTGLPNRREFMSRLEDELQRVKRNLDEHAAVLMLDIDHFKRVNDEYGHPAGDAVLRQLAGVMRAGARRVDSLGRVGGEEFAILLPGADHGAALAYAERLRQSVADTPMTLPDGRSIHITISIGLGALMAGDATSDIGLVRADKGLYLAKEQGRNRVGQIDPA